MRKANNANDYELRDEYDLSKMTIVAKGRYASHRRAGKNVVILAPDVVQAFPTDETVNEALRLVMEIGKISSKRKAKGARTAKPKARTARPRLSSRASA